MTVLFQITQYLRTTRVWIALSTFGMHDSPGMPEGEISKRRRDEVPIDQPDSQLEQVDHEENRLVDKNTHGFDTNK